MRLPKHQVRPLDIVVLWTLGGIGGMSNAVVFISVFGVGAIVLLGQVLWCLFATDR